MANNVLVNNIDHKKTRVITERSAKYGDNIWCTLTFPQEFRSVQAYYPIFFHKDSNSGQFMAVALFGLKHEENLFLKDNQWDAAYIPLTIQRQPFLIGSQNATENGVKVQRRVLHIDMDNPRVNTDVGEPLFLEFGSNTPYLDRAADMMEALHHGIEDSHQFINTLVELELLESFTLDVELNDKSKHQMSGFYTVNEDKLAELSDEVILSLHKNGYLAAIYMSIASQSNIRDLLNRKNAQLGL
ncbi:MAG: hypothetical protein ACI8WB_006199 [Phenylobacterium sp.]|jgi:hypothetical protein